MTEADWQVVTSLVPGRSYQQCYKRWLFIQQKGGKKLAWTREETEILR